jgi:hypothetical protein
MIVIIVRADAHGPFAPVSGVPFIVEMLLAWTDVLIP